MSDRVKDGDFSQADPEEQAGEIRGGDTGAQSSQETPLPLVQLVLRRGLTLVVAILALVSGIVAHLTFPPPEPGLLGEYSTLAWGDSPVSNPTPLPNTTLQE